MSAAGANPTAKVSGSGAAGMARYNRVKGEAGLCPRGSATESSGSARLFAAELGLAKGFITAPPKLGQFYGLIEAEG
jgi:hypothetical protein